MVADDDSSLVQAARGGDMDAFAQLLVRHRPVLLALCRQTLGNPALAEDAAQEASLQALRSLDRLRHAERFGPWLSGIGINVCRMWLRTHAHESRSWDALRRPLEAQGYVDEHGTEPTARILHVVSSGIGHADPAARAAAADLSACVRQAVATLPRGQRSAVQLFYLSGLSYKETAAVLGIEEGTVRTRLHKARGTLRGSLRSLGEEENMVMESKQVRDEAAMGDGQKTEYTCSFCGKKNAEVQRMIGGPPPLRAIICNECIGLCNQIIAEEEAKAAVQ